MKYKLIIIFMLFSNSIFAQILIGIGVDLGENIIPHLSNFQGGGGSVIFEFMDKKNKNFMLEFGYSDFRRVDNKLNTGYYNGKFNQQSAGFYGFFSREITKYLGWQTGITIHEVNTVLTLKDDSFNQFYQYKIPKSRPISIGFGGNVSVPIKITKHIQTQIRGQVSIVVPLGFKDFGQLVYFPNFGQSLTRPSGCFSLSIPLIYRFGERKEKM